MGSPHPIFSSSYACARSNAEIAAARAGQEECIRVIKKVFPASMVHWCPLKRGHTSGDIRQYCPGNTDIIGPDYYDNYPASTTEAEWAKNSVAVTSSGAPVGIKAWMDFARAKGKTFGVGEWGIGTGVAGDDDGSAGGDNPLFIRKMYEAFHANRDNMAYEIYFNSGNHVLDAANPANPKASAAYRAVYATLT